MENARATFDFCYRFLGPIAQWLEQGSHKPLVPGSNPGGPITFPGDFSAGGHPLRSKVVPRPLPEPFPLPFQLDLVDESNQLFPLDIVHIGEGDSNPETLFGNRDLAENAKIFGTLL